MSDWRIVEEITVPAYEARATRVRAGDRLRVSTPEGAQASDFFTFNADNLDEWLSPHHSWVWNSFMRPREGQEFMSNHRNAILRFVEDGAGGFHDMYLAPCDEPRFRQLGSDRTKGCQELMADAMRELGYEAPPRVLDINLFTATEVTPDQRLTSKPNPVPPGAYAVFEALMDVICVCTSCPWQLKDPWPINADAGITPIEMRVLTRVPARAAAPT
jgi:uncharacterized protein YcgI (DUF1989 family)